MRDYVQPDEQRVMLEGLEPRLLLSAATTDEFTSFDSSLWTFTDPLGDSNIVVSDGELRISVAGGESHDVWRTGFDAPRIMQTIDDEDFTLEVKFTEPPVGRYAMNGVVVAADNGDFVRFDFYSSSTTSVRLFAAGFRGLTPSVKIDTAVGAASATYMRIQREGDLWTQSYSADGNAWTTGASFVWAMDVSEAGLFVGNAGGTTAPAFTGSIDYFRDIDGSTPDPPADDTQPPQIASVAVDSGQTTADVSFTTDEPTTVSVQIGRTTSYELGAVSGSSAATAHTIRLTGLEPDSTYQYRIIATDLAGNVTTSPNRRFTTDAATGDDPVWSGDGGSDEFNSGSLDTSLWTFVNPVGDGTVSANGSQLLITAPSGAAHDMWKDGADAPRVMQAVADEDFEIVVKFDSRPAGAYAVNGIMIDAGGGTYLRFDFYSTSDSTVRVFAASFTNNAPSVKLNRVVSNAAPAYMRITREGDRWTQSYSFDGAAWTTGASFSFALNVAAAGVFAGNAGSNPAYTAKVDYFRINGGAVNPGGDDDVTAPQILSITAAAGASYVDVSFSTNETTTASVRYGLTGSYELGVVSSTAAATSHTIRLTNLPTGATIHYQILVADAAGNAAASTDRVVQLAEPTQGDTDIDLWYGSTQSFGAFGAPQPQVNILGRVSDGDGVASLSFTLNGGGSRTLSIGPDNRRLAEPGDFNIEIDRAELKEGANTVEIRAVDGRGDVTVTTVRIDYTVSPGLSAPLTVNWASAGSIQNVAQVVDGLWTIEGDTVRPVELGYDRLIALGEATWTDYEVVVPITIHGMDPAGYASPSNGPAVGILVRWQGHYDWNGSQPSYGYAPLGAIGWYRWDSIGADPTLQIYGSWSKLAANTEATLEMGVEYVWKMRAETLANGLFQYSLKVWPAGQGEPDAWSVAAITSTGLEAGSVMLLAHHVDASFGEVTITPV